MDISLLLAAVIILAAIFWIMLAGLPSRCYWPAAGCGDDQDGQAGQHWQGCVIGRDALLLGCCADQGGGFW